MRDQGGGGGGGNPQQYLVFFNFDSAALNDDTRGRPRSGGECEIVKPDAHRDRRLVPSGRAPTPARTTGWRLQRFTVVEDALSQKASNGRC